MALRDVMENTYTNYWDRSNTGRASSDGDIYSGVSSAGMTAPSMQYPTQEQPGFWNTAFPIIHKGGQGALAGTATGNWVVTIIGAVLGLAEGIVGAAVGSSQDQKSYNAQLQAFNNQMRYYYENANNVVEEMRQRRKEMREDKAYARKNFERRMKLDAFLTGRKMKQQQRDELAQRWGTPVQRGY